MKILKIEDGKGYFLTKENKYEKIDKIDKSNLFRLVEASLVEEVEFDEYDTELLKNKAHQIIYKSILEKLEDLVGRRDEFKDESDRLFHREYERYTGETS